MNIPEDKIQEIIQAADIVDVVSKYVRLRKTGINYKGLCPFHNEKTPSFSVNAKKTDFLLFWLPQRGKCDQVFDGI
jgi:DNA primase